MRFLLTPLREGRPPRFPGIPRRDSYFYSRPCGRGDHRPAQLPEGLRSNFYSRPCGRGDQLLAEIAKKMAEISTHAPAGGATADARSQGGRGLISTHAPAGGATRRLTRSGR